jgi:hypothetical protein
MSPTSVVNRGPARAAVVVALVIALAAITWLVRPQEAESVGPAAVPNSERVGTLTFSGFSTETVDVRSFAFGAQATPCDPQGTGGCAGRPNLSEPQVTLDSGPTSPDQLATLVAGEHMQRLTVVLYKPFTTKRSQEYVFDDTSFTQLSTTAGAPNTDEPLESLGWSFRKVTHRVYTPGTNTVLSETCWDVAQNRQC